MILLRLLNNVCMFRCNGNGNDDDNDNDKRVYIEYLDYNLCHHDDPVDVDVGEL